MGDELASFRRADRPEGVCLVVEGEIDLANISRFRTEAAALIDDARSPAVVDLTGITFFNSTGLGALVETKQACEVRDVQLVVEVSPAVHRVLEVTGLRDMFEVRERNP